MTSAGRAGDLHTKAPVDEGAIVHGQGHLSRGGGREVHEGEVVVSPQALEGTEDREHVSQCLVGHARAKVPYVHTARQRRLHGGRCGSGCCGGSERGVGSCERARGNEHGNEHKLGLA